MSKHIKIKITDKTNMLLAQSACLMLSDDYKERFMAEYLQVLNRLAGLKKMLKEWDDPNSELSFTPTCPRATYNFQVKAMQEYKDILEVRAKMEGIDVNNIVVGEPLIYNDIFDS